MNPINYQKINLNIQQVVIQINHILFHFHLQLIILKLKRRHQLPNNLLKIDLDSLIFLILSRDYHQERDHLQVVFLVLHQLDHP